MVKYCSKENTIYLGKQKEHMPMDKIIYYGVLKNTSYNNLI